MKAKAILKGIGRVLTGTARTAIPLAGPLVDTVLEVLNSNANSISGTPEQKIAWERMRGEFELKRDRIKSEVEQKLLESDAEISKVTQATLRTSLASGDAYVRRMTPTIGYAWLVILISNYAVTALANVFQSGTPLGPVALPWEFWMVGGALLGFRIHSRRLEKEKGVAS